MSISEEKIKTVINNYFKAECSVDTTIREAFEKGFRLGIRKVEVVRCKDCKFNKAKDKNKGVCDFMIYIHNADDYCSYGERKEQDHE